MTDIKSSKERSLNMAKIRNKDTKPEIWFRKKLFEKGYRYRKNVNYLPGHPDLWLSKYHTAIFVHGCFWHRHENCKYAYMPKSRVDFWITKFNNNIKRDSAIRNTLKNMNIKTLVIWECTIKKMNQSKDIEEDILDKTESFLKSEDIYFEL